MKNNNGDFVLRPYKQNYEYSYTVGAYPTIELLKARPERAVCVYLHSRCDHREALQALCPDRVPLLEDDRVFARLNLPGGQVVLGVFQKPRGSLCPRSPHVALISPQDMGNLGTIARTLLGFGFENLAVIGSAADVWHPKTVRASMGALFWLNTAVYPGFDEYRAAFGEHWLYPFMTDAPQELRGLPPPGDRRFSLVFGSESCGLEPRYAALGTPVRIPQTGRVDSLNLAVAVGIAAYSFWQAE